MPALAACRDIPFMEAEIYIGVHPIYIIRRGNIGVAFYMNMAV
jgi:hypothetical protein